MSCQPLSRLSINKQYRTLHVEQRQDHAMMRHTACACCSQCICGARVLACVMIAVIKNIYCVHRETNTRHPIWPSSSSSSSSSMCLQGCMNAAVLLHQQVLRVQHSRSIASSTKQRSLCQCKPQMCPTLAAATTALATAAILLPAIAPTAREAGRSPATYIHSHDHVSPAATNDSLD